MGDSDSEASGPSGPIAPPPTPETPPSQEALAAAFRYIINSGVAVQQPAAQPTAAAIRRGKFTKLFEMLKFKSKLQTFTPSGNDEIREWLEIFDVEISSIARNSCQLDIVLEPLTDQEYSELLLTKLSHSVKRELEQKFATEDPVLTWDGVTKQKLKELLKEQFGPKEHKMSSILNLFGANRFKKAPDMPVRNFYCQWSEQLP